MVMIMSTEQMCSPSPVMVTSPYELKFFESDEKPQTNKQKQQEAHRPYHSPEKPVQNNENI